VEFAERFDPEIRAGLEAADFLGRIAAFRDIKFYDIVFGDVTVSQKLVETIRRRETVFLDPRSPSSQIMDPRVDIPERSALARSSSSA